MRRTAPLAQRAVSALRRWHVISFTICKVGFVFGLRWAKSGTWEWKVEPSGDKLTPLLGFLVTRRPNFPPIFHVVLGPLVFSTMVGR